MKNNRAEYTDAIRRRRGEERTMIRERVTGTSKERPEEEPSQAENAHQQENPEYVVPHPPQY